MITRCTIPADVAYAAVEDGTVVLHMGTKRYYSLNETGAAVWRMLEQEVPVSEVPARLRAEFDVAVEEADLAVNELLATLAEQQLLVIDSA
jgi:Coenzyme PQQ synthesis protein D (PqqD)